MECRSSVVATLVRVDFLSFWGFAQWIFFEYRVGLFFRGPIHNRDAWIGFLGQCRSVFEGVLFIKQI